jgi:hypothetical protein
MHLHYVAPHMPYVKVSVNLTNNKVNLGHIYLWGERKMNKIYHIKSYFGQVA